jgi:broad specificity phosphatase PhoE
LERAAETAEIIYGKPIPKANQLIGLKERYWGALEGKSRKLILAGNENSTMTHQERWLYKHVPDMESDHEVSWRFMSELEKIAKKNIGKTILVVGHGGAIRATLMKIQNLTHKDFPPGSFRNAGYAELVYEDGRFKVGQVVGVQI